VLPELRPIGAGSGKVVNLVRSGNALNPLQRSTLYHDPGACIISERRVI
jgi:hypothetical protein